MGLSTECKRRRALLSVSDKTGLVSLGRGLEALGLELVSTGGTSRVLAEAGLAVLSVSEVTGFPEMLEGRVKTLHPAIHGGILARRQRPDDLEAIGRHGIQPVDLVVVNLYPFATAAANPATTFDALVEEIDIGGPSLVRAAAKNFRDVLVVVDPGDYARVLAALEEPAGPSPALRFELARKAFAHTAAYDSTIASTLDGVDGGRRWIRGARRRRTSACRSCCARTSSDAGCSGMARIRTRRRAGMQSPGAPGFGDVRVLQGKELSYTNLLDLDAAARIVLEFDEPAAAVVKHTNPCGAATGRAIAAAYVAAREADPLSAFGGIVGLNRPLDADTARAIVSTFIEAVIAPAVAAEAQEILGRRPTCGCSPPTSRSSRVPRAESWNCDRSWADCSSRNAIGWSKPLVRGATRGRRRGWSCPSPDGRRVAGPSLCVARVRPRQIQQRPLCRR